MIAGADIGDDIRGGCVGVAFSESLEDRLAGICGRKHRREREVRGVVAAGGGEAETLAFRERFREKASRVETGNRIGGGGGARSSFPFAALALALVDGGGGLGFTVCVPPVGTEVCGWGDWNRNA